MRIAEVSARCGVSADTLRYYERIGLLRHVGRNAAGIREYSEANCATVMFLKCMRAAGMSIESLGEYIDLFEQGDSTLMQRKALLEEQRELMRARIADMQAGLDRLDYKIENYESVIVAAEKRMISTDEEINEVAAHCA